MTEAHKTFRVEYKSIFKYLCNKRVNKEFWKKEKDNIDRIVKNGKNEKSSMYMSNDKFKKQFTI